VLSQVASKVIVALNEPAICTDTFPLDGKPTSVAASFCAATVTLLRIWLPTDIAYLLSLRGQLQSHARSDLLIREFGSFAVFALVSFSFMPFITKCPLDQCFLPSTHRNHHKRMILQDITLQT